MAFLEVQTSGRFPVRADRAAAWEVTLALHSEVRVGRGGSRPPRCRTRTAAQGLAGSDVAGPVPGMVDNADGEAVAALQLAQEGEQRRHFAAEVLVDETRLQLGDGLVEAGTVGLGRSPRSPSRN